MKPGMLGRPMKRAQLRRIMGMEQAAAILKENTQAREQRSGQVSVGLDKNPSSPIAEDTCPFCPKTVKDFTVAKNPNQAFATHKRHCRNKHDNANKN